MPTHARRTPNFGPGHNVGLTVDEEQRACFAVLKRLTGIKDRALMCEALNIWPDEVYQAYLNGSSK